MVLYSLKGVILDIILARELCFEYKESRFEDIQDVIDGSRVGSLSDMFLDDIFTMTGD